MHAYGWLQCGGGGCTSRGARRSGHRPGSKGWPWRGARTLRSPAGASFRGGNAMRRTILEDRWVGDGYPTYIVAEIGINHNGSIEIARRLIDAAVAAGCDAVKFQKRTPERCVPPWQRDQLRDTPWGTMTYLEYRRRIEFDAEVYHSLAGYCRQKGI